MLGVRWLILQRLDHRELSMLVDKQFAKLIVPQSHSNKQFAKRTWNVWLITQTSCQIAGTADGHGYIRVGHLCWIDICSATQATVSIALANLYFSIPGSHGLDLHFPRIEGNTLTYFEQREGRACCRMLACRRSGIKCKRGMAQTLMQSCRMWYQIILTHGLLFHPKCHLNSKTAAFILSAAIR